MNNPKIKISLVIMKFVLISFELFSFLEVVIVKWDMSWSIRGCIIINKCHYNLYCEKAVFINQWQKQLD